MKSFQQFMLEVYDPEVQGRSQITQQGDGGRIGRKRKQTDAEKKRVKAVGGGQTEPAKTYKDKADIGVTNRKRSPAGRQQQPTQTRGSAALSAREAQRKAAQERRAAKSGAKTKTADELLAKKAKKTVDPNYKVHKGTPGAGPSKKTYSSQERKALVKQGERRLRDLRLQSTGKSTESELKNPITQKEITRRNKKK